MDDFGHACIIFTVAVTDRYGNEVPLPAELATVYGSISMAPEALRCDATFSRAFRSETVGLFNDMACYFAGRDWVLGEYSAERPSPSDWQAGIKEALAQALRS